MRRRKRVTELIAPCAGAAVLCGVALAEPTEYVLLDGSTITDGCLECKRLPIVRPIAGTFTLEFIESIPGATSYRAGAIEFTDPEEDYVVRGAGIYRQIITAEPTHNMDLDLEVTGMDGAAAGVKLSTETVETGLAWPAIAITVTEPGTRDPDHLYTLRLLATPRPKGWQTYDVLDGSYIVNACPVCRSIPLRITGSFLLGDIDSGANPMISYAIDRLDLSSEHEPLPRAGGIYRQGGEAAIVQDMGLVLDIDGLAGVLLTAELNPPPAAWPAIDVTLVQRNSDSPNVLYYLRLVAEPDDSRTPFKRGDANADRDVDIADAVFTLAHLFAHGPAPSCSDAADANDDGGLNIADAVALLSHLFARTGPLPDPFAKCGLDTTGMSDCDSFLPCE